MTSSKVDQGALADIVQKKCVKLELSTLDLSVHLGVDVRDIDRFIEKKVKFQSSIIDRLIAKLGIDSVPSTSYESKKKTHNESFDGRNTKNSDGIKTVNIFLASSEELLNDRNEFDLYFRQRNDFYRGEGLYLKIVRWENFIDSMSESGLQSEYNKAVRDCDLFVSLFSTKAGIYTEEEFDIAFQTYKSKQTRPLVYTYFKKSDIDSSNRTALQSLWKFQDKLKSLGHYPTDYDGIEHLRRHFSDQLIKLRSEDKLPFR